jgi:hypothetical protein
MKQYEKDLLGIVCVIILTLGGMGTFMLAMYSFVTWVSDKSFYGIYVQVLPCLMFLIIAVVIFLAYNSEGGND